MLSKQSGQSGEALNNKHLPTEHHWSCFQDPHSGRKTIGPHPKAATTIYIIQWSSSSTTYTQHTQCWWYQSIQIQHWNSNIKRLSAFLNLKIRLTLKIWSEASSSIWHVIEDKTEKQSFPSVNGGKVPRANWISHNHKYHLDAHHLLFVTFIVLLQPGLCQH